MVKWDYIITSGKKLREAIHNEDIRLVVKALLLCYKELYSKLSDEDKDWKGMDIEDSIENLSLYTFDLDDEDDEDNVNYYLDEFYNLCDDLKAWVEI